MSVNFLNKLIFGITEFSKEKIKIYNSIYVSGRVIVALSFLTLLLFPLSCSYSLSYLSFASLDNDYVQPVPTIISEIETTEEVDFVESNVMTVESNNVSNTTATPETKGGSKEPINTPTAINPTATDVPTVVPNATLEVCMGKNTSGMNINVRNGPGLDYAIVDTLENGEEVEVYGKNGTWFQIDNLDEEWAFATYISLYDSCGEVPFVSFNGPTVTSVPEPTTIPTSIPTQIPVNTSVPTDPPQVALCECSYNAYNCSGANGFATCGEAEACFNYCISIGAGDIHDLDRDGDGPCDNLCGR